MSNESPKSIFVCLLFFWYLKYIVYDRIEHTMLAEIFSGISHFFRTFPYKESIEILFFSAVIYTILLWLRRDTDKSLLAYFYGYCSIFFVAHYADLPVIRFALFISAPFVAVIFIIMHQEMLQKNFINLVRPAPLFETSHWVDELMKCCLMALNRHREIIVIIERQDQLKSLIHAPYFIYAELKKDIFDILLEKHVSTHDYMLWINQQGKIVAINCAWRTHIDETWIAKEAENIHLWKQQAIFFTSKTDALLFKINPLTRSFDIIMNGHILENVTAEHTARFMKKNLIQVKSTVKEKAADLKEKPPSEKTV